MSEYRVTWAIDIDATTPHAAARLAWEILQDPTSLAPIFEVTSTDGTSTEIDMQAEEENR